MVIADIVMRDQTAVSPDHSVSPVAIMTHGRTSTKRVSEDIVDIDRLAKMPRLAETCTRFVFDKLIELTPFIVSAIVEKNRLPKGVQACV
jgi:hypothetical protein